MGYDRETAPTQQDAFNMLTKAEYLKWDKQQLNRQLAVMKDFQYCPMCPSGGYIAHSCNDINCVDCSHVWCRECRLPPHSNMTCDAFRKVCSSSI